jgi:hypothetical protein
LQQSGGQAGRQWNDSLAPLAEPNRSVNDRYTQLLYNIDELNQADSVAPSSHVTSKTLVACVLIQFVAPLIGFLCILLAMSLGGNEYSLLGILSLSVTYLPMIISTAPEPFSISLIATQIIACYTRSKRTLYILNTFIAVLNGLTTGFVAIGRSM